MKCFIYSIYYLRRIRIIGLSATLPNLVDIGEWLGCPPNAIHYFDDSFRPVPLEVHTMTYGPATNPFLFEKSLDKRVGEVIHRFSRGKQTLIFCSSKKNAETLCEKLKQEEGLLVPVNKAEAAIIAQVQDTFLRSLISYGFAYHHAGLPPDDRMIVERLYLAGNIRVLCSTSTLAHGINLPAHLVIIKGTYCWRGSSKGYERLSHSDVIQMLGRAGRPGFDESGVAIIMTSTDDQQHYAANLLSAGVVESSLPTILNEGKMLKKPHPCFKLKGFSLQLSILRYHRRSSVLLRTA